MRVMSAVRLLFSSSNKHKVCSEVASEEEPRLNALFISRRGVISVNMAELRRTSDKTFGEVAEKRGRWMSILLSERYLMNVTAYERSHWVSMQKITIHYLTVEARLTVLSPSKIGHTEYHE